MNSNEVAVVIDRLAAVFRHRVEGEEYQAWAEYLDDLGSGEAAIVTVERLAKNHDGFMPTIARFRDTYAEVLREQARTARELGHGGPHPDCPLCAGTEWEQVDPKVHLVDPATGESRRDEMTVRPCRFCFPQGYDRFLEELPKRRRALRIRPDETADFDRSAMLHAAQARLAEVES